MKNITENFQSRMNVARFYYDFWWSHNAIKEISILSHLSSLLSQKKKINFVSFHQRDVLIIKQCKWYLLTFWLTTDSKICIYFQRAYVNYLVLLLSSTDRLLLVMHYTLLIASCSIFISVIRDIKSDYVAFFEVITVSKTYSNENIIHKKIVLKW